MREKPKTVQNNIEIGRRQPYDSNLTEVESFFKTAFTIFEFESKSRK